MKFYKFFMALALIGSMNLSFTSCSDDDDKSEETEAEAGSESWKALVNENSWLSDFPNYPGSIYSHAGISQNLMISDITGGTEMRDKYAALLIAAGFEKADLAYKYTKKTDSGKELTVTMDYQGVQESNGFTMETDSNGSLNTTFSVN